VVKKQQYKIMEEKKAKRISKFLSLILRHNPETIGLHLDKNGWAEVSELLEKSKKGRVHFDANELVYIVKTNNKQRFSFNEDHTKIRANQGHSLQHIQLELEPQTPPAFLYHGTVAKFMDAIRAKGLLKINRQHVHLSTDRATATNVGSRRGKPIILSIRAEEMYHKGYIFYRSANGVWLTDHVPSTFISFKNEKDDKK
jgi:putative RNA 2'-phosphotransferase